MSVQLGRELTQASYVSQDGEADEGLSITLSQPQGSTSRWLMVVKAQVDEGLAVLGHFYTCPPRADSPKSRVVALAACPGARKWTVDISPAPPLGQDPIVMDPDPSYVMLGGGDATTCCEGVQRVSERPKLLSGAAGQVVVHWGERIIAITAVGVSGGTLDIADPFNGVLLSTVFIPNNVPLRIECDGLFQGTLVLTFANTSSFVVELAESA